MLRIMIRRLCFALLPIILIAGFGTSNAKSIKVKPSSHHRTLTLSTSGKKGLMISPKHPMKLKVVGPGKLNITARLNSTKKRREFKGVLEIKANGKRLQSVRLNLFMSRVASYRKNKSLHPSTPKKLTVKIPDGLQQLKISLKANRRTSITVSLSYESNADQSAAQDEEMIALVPLVPAGKRQKTADELEIVPLVPLVPVETPKRAVHSRPKTSKAVKRTPPTKPKTIASNEANKRSKPASDPASEEFELYQTQTKPEPRHKVATRPVALNKPKQAKKTITPVETNKAHDEAEVSTRPPPANNNPFFSLGLYAGEISPFQAIGTSSPTGTVDARYILPVFDGRLSLGLGVSYHRFSASIGYDNSTSKTTVTMDAIPVSLQLFYRIPLDTLIEPFVGAGADMVIGLAEVEYENSGSSASDTAVGFGGHLSIGAEAGIGPGFLTIEVRAGLGDMDLDVLKNLNPSGLSVLAGYRLEI